VYSGLLAEKIVETFYVLSSALKKKRERQKTVKGFIREAVKGRFDVLPSQSAVGPEQAGAKVDIEA